MKKFIISIIFSFFITSEVLARSTGCKEGNCENGYGKWVYTDKTTYEGEWVNTKKHGQGTETWPNGYIYKGEFKNSEWSGQGTLTFPNGATYVGEWANGFMNGKGTFTWSDGKEKTGISAYGSYDLGDDMSLFGRYDELSSENDWNLDKDGTFMIAGVEKVMTKGVKASLNYQSFTEAKDGAESENTMYLSLEYKF